MSSSLGRGELTQRSTSKKARWERTNQLRLQPLKHHTVFTNQIIPLCKCCYPDNRLLGDGYLKNEHPRRIWGVKWTSDYNGKLEGGINISIAEQPRWLSVRGQCYPSWYIEQKCKYWNIHDEDGCREAELQPRTPVWWMLCRQGKGTEEMGINKGKGSSFFFF